MDYVVVGLGNPGKEYDNTRHNVGYRAIDILCERNSVSLSKETPSTLSATIRINEKKVLLVRTTSYMNDSGVGIGEIVRRYKIEPEQLIILQDELDLEFGVVKIKKGGGLAGHNGLRSINQHIKSTDFLRVRIGVDKPSHKSQGADHVLRKMSAKENEIADIACAQAADAVEMIVGDSLDKAMLVTHSL